MALVSLLALLRGAAFAATSFEATSSNPPLDDVSDPPSLDGAPPASLLGAPLDGACADATAYASHCAAWAAAGECARNAAFMHESCRRSCGVCAAAPASCDGAQGSVQLAEACADEHESCSEWALQEECAKNPVFMEASCRASCYVCESSACRDEEELCAQWAAAGECAKNEAYMVVRCAFSCRVCFLERSAECRRDEKMAPAAVNGTIDATFERLLGYPGARALSREPWIVHLDRFLQPEEADVLIKVAGHDFQRSRATGDEDSSSASAYARTSMTSWCNVPSCMDDPRFVAVRDRISALMDVPWQNSEHLQLLKYEVGQFYTEHHDQISPRHSAWGPRLYTFFMYLSDVEEGGETRFTRLNLTVSPSKGSAIVWPSVFSHDLFRTDERTFHEAVNVTKGVKYAANFWIHMYDFQGALARGCDNKNYLQPTSVMGAQGAS
ncbi:hypothetical protein AB1Y20_010121 [Prymnesium parvum]|uniref:Procollagen-proline 4-dioxygenase n=1 Tax=Prymnesium parvum TaxID=97485 RepID=A0AB34K7E6_PRYPA